MIEKQEESVGYLLEIEKKHKNHEAMGPRSGGSNSSSAMAKEGKELSAFFPTGYTVKLKRNQRGEHGENAYNVDVTYPNGFVDRGIHGIFELAKDIKDSISMSHLEGLIGARDNPNIPMWTIVGTTDAKGKNHKDAFATAEDAKNVWSQKNEINQVIINLNHRNKEYSEKYKNSISGENRTKLLKGKRTGDKFELADDLGRHLMTIDLKK